MFGSGELSSADAFAQLAIELHDVDGVEETVEAVIQFSLQALSCKYAGVVLIVHHHKPEIAAVTDPGIEALYRLQIEADSGPMMTAAKGQAAVLIRDTAIEDRWSDEWVALVTELGIGSALHLPLAAGRRTGGLLSLFHSAPDGFSDDDLAVAHILARHASIAVANARHERDLIQAVDARKLVGQAMGILMERFCLDSDRAFQVLKRYSQDNNRKLRDVAQELIDTRKLPGQHR